MAANTGPDINTYAIPEVELGDTFNVWKDITNTGVYKLNKMSVYAGVSSSDLAASTDASGNLSYLLAPNIPTGHTFTGNIGFTAPVVFTDGVTFNGPVTFNATTFTVNANIVTIDDYNIYLGDTGAASDANISTAGGGGLILNRGGGLSADWLWSPTGLYGITGVWAGEGHIGFKGPTAGIRPNGGGNLLVHGTGIRIDGGGTAEHGVQISFGGSGTTSGRTIEMYRYSPAGSTAFADIALRTAPGVSGQRPFVSVRDGVNKKTITQTNHLFSVGTPVRLNASGSYAAALADDPVNAEVVGIVSRVIDGNNFELTFLGEVFDINFNSITVDGTAGITGSVYYLSPYVAGKITSAYPTLTGTVHKAVLIATSSTSALVLPWTGGVLSQSISLGESTSNTVKIQQLNQFKPGDVVRFKAYTPGQTLTYGPSGATQEQFYSYGIYVRADAKDQESSDGIAGMVTSTTEIAGYPGINESFNLMMDGFFVATGITAYYNGTPGPLVAGTNYFLRDNVAGTTGSFEGATASLTNQVPTGTNTVSKPMLMATSPTSGYVYSYRGSVTSYVTNPAQLDISQALIKDIRSNQDADLVFGVYNSGIAGGYQVMKFDKTNKGNILVGSSSFTNSTIGAGATLSIAGIVAAGDATATDGSTILCSRYSSTIPTTLNVFGSQNSTGNTVLSYGVRPRQGAAGYVSTSANSLARAAVEVGVDTDSATFRFLGYNNTAHATPGRTGTALGAVVPLTELMKMTVSGATFTGMVASTTGFSGPLFGTLTGNASTATTLQTARDFSLTGDITASAVSFNGSGNVQLTTAIAEGSIVNADISASAAIADTKLATISTAGKVANAATTATTANTDSTIVLRGAAGAFNSGLITCTSNPTTANHLTRKGYVDDAARIGSTVVIYRTAQNALVGVPTGWTVTPTNNTGVVTINAPSGTVWRGWIAWGLANNANATTQTPIAVTGGSAVTALNAGAVIYTLIIQLVRIS